MIVIVLRHPKRKGKIYRVAVEKDLEIYKNAEKCLEERKIKLMKEWGFDPFPSELIFTPRGEEYKSGSLYYNFTPIVLYGLTKWGDLFNSRQKLTLLSFLEKVKSAYHRVTKECDSEYSKAIETYLSITLDRLVSFNSNLTLWVARGEFIQNTFTRQALPMIWDYCELNPFSEATGGWSSALKWVCEVIEHCSYLRQKGLVTHGTATNLPYPDNFFDVIITDPPYYDNVPYSVLSDFFYVWLKRTVGDLYPELFATPLTPKSEEIIDELSLLRGMDKEKAYKMEEIKVKGKKEFEEMITEAFKEIYRVLKPNGIACIVFAHKSTEAWEVIINSLIKSGFILSASWPIHTERARRLRARESAALLSSIFMICRKRRYEKEIYFKDIEQELKERIHERLEYFWKQGISGADFFISAIGPAVEVFGRYSKVKKLTGEKMSVKELLNYVRTEVIEYVLKKILKGAELGLVDPLTRFYITWRWTYGRKKVLFDDARKLAQASGIEITALWNNGLVKKEKEWITVLGPKERKDLKLVEKRMKKEKIPIIDALHYACILWEQSKRKELEEFLSETGYLQNEAFWLTAQALSEILEECKEKRLIQGLLVSRRDLRFRKQPTIKDYMKEV